jgi:hypothetical protein
MRLILLWLTTKNGIAGHQILLVRQTLLQVAAFDYSVSLWPERIATSWSLVLLFIGSNSVMGDKTILFLASFHGSVVDVTVSSCRLAIFPSKNE